jgi:hypothetical protein
MYLGMAQVFEWPRSDAVGEGRQGKVKDRHLDRVCEDASAPKEACKRFKRRYDQQRRRIQTYLVTSRDGLRFDLSTVYAGTPLVNYATSKRKECNFETVASNVVTHGG